MRRIGANIEKTLSINRRNIQRMGQKVEKRVDIIGANRLSMKYWPVPESFEKKFPQPGSPGCFWENRGDMFHCGVDIYAPNNAETIAIAGGRVVDKGVFTSPESAYYWKKTYYLIINTSERINYKYAQLSEVSVHIGDYVDAGQFIGRIGVAFNQDNLSPDAPFFVREFLHNGNPSMLHLELYKAPICEVRPYAGGNFSGKQRPLSLLDPVIYLSEITNSNGAQLY